MKYFRSTPPEKRVLVHTFEVPCKCLGKTGKLFIHLYETEKGLRSCEFAITILGLTNKQIEKGAKCTEVYQKRVVRWLNGRYDPDIRSYEDVPKEDAFNKLKGSVE